MTKMTYAQAIDFAINGTINEEVVEKLEALKVQLSKRSTSKKGMTKTQKENEVLKGQMVEFLATNGAKRATEVGSAFGISGQKASALLKQLVEAGQVVKLIDKKVVTFDVAEDEQFLEDEVTA